MKKLMVVFTAILVVAFAAPAFADDDAAFSGEFDFGGITAFDSETTNYAFANVYLDGKFAVGDYNTVLLEFNAADWINMNAGSNTYLWYASAANLESDIGEAAGLPIGLKVRGGLSAIDMRKYEVSAHAYERPVRPGIGGMGIFGIIDAGMVTIDIGVGFDIGVVGTPVQDYGVMVTVPEIGPVSAQVGYLIANDDDFKGKFQVNVKAEDIADMISVAGGFTYDTQTDGAPAAAPAWLWGLGVKANVSNFGIGVSINGEEEAAVNKLGIDVNVGVTDEFGIDVGVGLGLDDDLAMFGGLEPSIYYKTGAATWRLGYLLSSASDTGETDSWAVANAMSPTFGGYKLNAPALANDATGGSGLFISGGIDF